MDESQKKKKKCPWNEGKKTKQKTKRKEVNIGKAAQERVWERSMKSWTGSTRNESKHSPLAPTRMKMSQHTGFTSGWVLPKDVKRPEKEN